MMAVVASFFVAAGCAPDLAVDYGGEPGASACRPGLAPHDVQGSGTDSPLAGQTLDLVGVATLAARLAPEREGFFLQSLEADVDPLTSEALFVTWPGTAPAPGTRVRARGTVVEAAGITLLGAVERLDECGSRELAPRPVDVRELEALEPWEGMWVRARGDWSVVDVSPDARGVTASPRGRLFASGHALAEHGAAELWTVRLADNPRPDRLPGTRGEPSLAGEPWPRLGAALGEIDGVLLAEASTRQLLTAAALPWRSTVPAAPARLPSSGLRICALNLHNYFVGLGSRGARSAAELDRQRRKLVAVITALDADILALTELENRGAESLIHLLEGLDRALPTQSRYAFEEAPAPSGSALRAGIAFRPSRVRPRDRAWFSHAAGFRRAPLFQSFESQGFSFTLAVVHLASKLCNDAPRVVPPEGCNADTREREAALLLDAAHALTDSAASEPLLLIGDFNADVREGPLELLASGGFEDLLSALPAHDRYSYVFEGRASLLDHALASSAFAEQVQGTAIWHINADEPLFPHERHDAVSDDPRRSSDHDPIVVDLRAGEVRPTGLRR